MRQSIEAEFTPNFADNWALHSWSRIGSANIRQTFQADFTPNVADSCIRYLLLADLKRFEVRVGKY